MSDDLVKRLREGTNGTDVTKTDAVLTAYMHEAADRIEELEAGLQKMALEYLDAASKSYQAQLKAEAKLAKAVEALVVIDALDPEGLIEGCSQSALRGLVLRMGATARTTLTELKGENDG